MAPSSTSHHQSHHHNHHHQLHHHQLIADAAGNVRPVVSSAEDVSRQHDGSLPLAGAGGLGGRRTILVQPQHCNGGGGLGGIMRPSSCTPQMQQG